MNPVVKWLLGIFAVLLVAGVTGTVSKLWALNTEVAVATQRQEQTEQKLNDIFRAIEKLDEKVDRLLKGP